MRLAGGRRVLPLKAIDLPEVANAITGFYLGGLNLIVTYHGADTAVTLFRRPNPVVTILRGDWAKIETILQDISPLNVPLIGGTVYPTGERLPFARANPALYHRVLALLQPLFTE